MRPPEGRELLRLASTILGLTGQSATRARISSASRGTAGSTTSSGPDAANTH